jgi:hypothetical protein
VFPFRLEMIILMRTMFCIFLTLALTLSCQEEDADILPPLISGPSADMSVQNQGSTPRDDLSEMVLQPGDMGIREPDLAARTVTGKPCGVESPCPDSAVCVAGSGWPEAFCDGECADAYCLQTCEGPRGCPTSRDEYQCVAFSQIDGLMAEGPELGCVPSAMVSRRMIGASCAGDEECADGACLTDRDLVRGYCTPECTSTCGASISPGRDARCVRWQGWPDARCLQPCSASADCRYDYKCFSGVCLPNRYESEMTDVIYFSEFTDAIDSGEVDLPVTCIELDPPGAVSFSYEVAAQTSAYMVVPFTRDGSVIEASHIELPDASRITFGSDYRFVIPDLHPPLFVPTIVPAAASLVSDVQMGLHRYHLQTEARQLCYYLLEEQTAGMRMDINIYFVHARSVEAETADSNPDVQEMWAAFDTVMGRAGITRGDVRYIQVEEELTNIYSSLGDQNLREALVALVEPPSSDRVLSMNVLMTDSCCGGSRLGVSPARPGPAGVHRSGVSGIAMTSRHLGKVYTGPDLMTEDVGGTVSGNEMTGLILAHEIGHWLGFGHDNRAGNFMQAVADVGQDEMNDLQQTIVQVHPLTR